MAAILVVADVASHQVQKTMLLQITIVVRTDFSYQT
jgi:hypothetical protein